MEQSAGYKKFLLLIGSVLLSALIIALLIHENYFFDTLDNERITVYKKKSIPERLSAGQFVILTTPENVKKYLHDKGLSAPTKKFYVKEIGGDEGDTFYIERGQFYINNGLVGSVYRIDSKGRVLSNIEPGRKQIVKSGNALLVETGKDYPFDSRYFGEIEKRNIISLAKPVYSFKKSKFF